MVTHGFTQNIREGLSRLATHATPLVAPPAVIAQQD
jgi:hypothetical protein